ncbi:hypothetical protein INT48_006024 [Thamnidium elegans]|uniref:Uncharacterized protein n=1 Tax=Thamnidium elegans TaxID=101142 RepID=A0A8H7SFQ1_9FUNG|nr:hypothetical protein INT48_006024 [Thamnidium elegans]
MLPIIFTFLVWLLCVNGFAPLRKHHSHLESPIDETNVIKNMSHLYTTDDSICGEASLSCMAFGASIPIRCGILTKAPLCKRWDAALKREKCDTFCDTDGSGRLCQRAFPSCCQGTVHGCTSSKPRNTILYK